MKKGFTLLELVVVIIIIGILATLGIQQFARMTERSRGAEARQILGQIRGSAAAHRLENACLDGSCGTGQVFNDTRAGIGAAANDMIPGPLPANCDATHYFSYAVTATTPSGFTATATRCVLANPGKAPQGAAANTLILTTDFLAGTDVWAGTGGY